MQRRRTTGRMVWRRTSRTDTERGTGRQGDLRPSDSRDILQGVVGVGENLVVLGAVAGQQSATIKKIADDVSVPSCDGLEYGRFSLGERELNLGGRLGDGWGLDELCFHVRKSIPGRSRCQEAQDFFLRGPGLVSQHHALVCPPTTTMVASPVPTLAPHFSHTIGKVLRLRGSPPLS